LTYLGGINFAGVSFDTSLRNLLTSGGFRLPGEAQKIERFLEAFAECYWRANKSSFSKPDMVLILSFSAVMLNTDLHNPNIKKSRKMTLEQFVRNLSGVDDGADLPLSLLTETYHSIERKEIALPRFDPEGQSKEKGGGSEDHGEGGNGGGHKREGGSDGAQLRRHAALYAAEMVSATRSGLALLRSGASTVRLFHSKVSTDLVKLMFEYCWEHAFMAVEAVLDSAAVIDAEPSNGSGGRVNERPAMLRLLSLCVDLLRNALCICIFIESARSIRSQFLDLLCRCALTANYGMGHPESLDALSTGGETEPSAWGGKVNDRNGGVAGTKDNDSKPLSSAFYECVMSAHLWDNDINDTVAAIHTQAQVIHNCVLARMEYEEVLNVQRRFNSSGGSLAHAPGRRFIREGSLVKQASTSNQRQRYEFFLFSDLLVYASVRFGRLSAHQLLPLKTMRVYDADAAMGGGSVKADGGQGSNEIRVSRSTCDFEIRSPVKSFVVTADNYDEKRSWMSAILSTIADLSRQRAEQQRRILALDGPEAEPTGLQRVSEALPSVAEEGGFGEENPDTDTDPVSHEAPTTAAEAVTPLVSTPSMIGPGATAASMASSPQEAQFIIALRFSRSILDGSHAHHHATDLQKFKFYG